MRYNELMNPQLIYEDIYENFELSEADNNIIKEIDEIDLLFKKHTEKQITSRSETIKLIEEKNLDDRFNLNWLLGQNLWKVLYVFLICLILSGCFILLFTGFSLSGKLEGLDKEEDSYNEGNDATTNPNNNNNKRGAEKK